MLVAACSSKNQDQSVALMGGMILLNSVISKLPGSQSQDGNVFLLYQFCWVNDLNNYWRILLLGMKLHSNLSGE